MLYLLLKWWRVIFTTVTELHLLVTAKQVFYQILPNKEARIKEQTLSVF